MPLIAMALERSYVFDLEFYCDNGKCLVRTIGMAVKDYDGVAMTAFRKRPKCPVCGSGLTLTKVKPG